MKQMKLSAIKLMASITAFIVCNGCNNQTRNDEKSGTMENSAELRKDTAYDASSLDSSAIPPFSSDMDTTGNADKN